MANPKKKHTPMRSRMRRASNFRLEGPNLSRDPKTGEWRMPHRISPSGHYNGELVRPPKVKKKKEEGKG